MVKTYLATTTGVYQSDGKPAATAHGSVLAGSLLYKGVGQPANQFVPLDRLTRMVPAHSSSFTTNLKSHIAKLVERDPAGFDEAIKSMGVL